MIRTIHIVATLAAPLAWAMTTGTGPAAPAFSCISSGYATLLFSAVATVVAVFGMVVAKRSATRTVGQDRFLLLSGSLASGAFAFAMLLQIIAIVMIDPCAR